MTTPPPQDTSSSWFDRVARRPAPPVPPAAPAGPLPAPAPIVPDPVPTWPAPATADDGVVAGAPAPVVGPEPDAADDGLLFEDGWHEPRRTSRVTALLVLAIVAALGFVGGAWAQRSHDTGLVGASGLGAGLGRRASGFPSGAAGFGGGGGFGGASGGGFGGQSGAGQTGPGQTGPGQSAAGQTGAGPTGSGTGVPVAVGTVQAVDGTSVTIKNFGGQTVVVHLTATTTVTAIGPSGLKAGTTVAVFGTKAADGAVTATSVVSRPAT